MLRRDAVVHGSDGEGSGRTGAAESAGGFPAAGDSRSESAAAAYDAVRGEAVRKPGVRRLHAEDVQLYAALRVPRAMGEGGVYGGFHGDRGAAVRSHCV